MNKSPIEDILNKSDFYVGVPHGSSMYPTLHHLKDTFHIIKPKMPIKKYDVVLYRRGNGKLVLHRVIQATPFGYTMCGDSQFIKEPNIMPQQILGIMDCFYRNNRKIYTSNRWYKLYVNIWCFSIPTKRILMWVYKCILKIGRCFNGAKAN